MTTRQRVRVLGYCMALAVIGVFQTRGPMREVESIQDRTGALYPRFGLIEPHDAPDIADSLGVGWGRARFHWAGIQPHSSDQWIDAELSPDQLEHELQAGREVIGLLIGIPDWARDERGLPRGLYLPFQDPGNTWAQFVREAVSRYHGRIDHWIIWNEPDVWDPGHPVFTWPGDEKDYVQLLKVAYLVAHEQNSNVVIHLAAVTHWWDALYGRELYFRRLLTAIVSDPEAAQYNYYYDAATLHVYFNPASVYELIEMYSSIQAEYGLDKPIWLVETNAAPSSDPGWTVAQPTFSVSLLEQAAYFPQALALALAAGAERVGMYKLIDTPGDYAANPEPFGLVRADRTPRPALQTATVALEQLADMEDVAWTDQHIVAQVVATKPGQITRVLWSRVPFAQKVVVPALSQTGTLIDMWGNAIPILPSGDHYEITLLAGECQETTADYCMIGGPPVYLVEHVQAGEEWHEGSLKIETRPFSDDISRRAGGGERQSLIVWLGLTGCILVLAAAGTALRVRTVRAS